MKSVINAMEDAVYLPWMPIWVFIFTVFTVWLLRRYVSSTFGKGVSAISQDEVADLRKPSLSASRMATQEHSGMSSPSLNKLMPTSTSNDP